MNSRGLYDLSLKIYIQREFNVESKKETFDQWRAQNSDEDFLKLRDGMVLLIEKAINGNDAAWTNAITSPYVSDLEQES